MAHWQLLVITYVHVQTSRPSTTYDGLGVFYNSVLLQGDSLSPVMLIPLLAANVLGGEITNLVYQTGPVAKVVLAILLLFSIFSWAIIVQKYGLMNKARMQSARFQRAFRKASRLQDVAAIAEQFKPSPLVAVFEGAYDELKKQGGLRNPVAVQRAMQIASSEELTRIERRLPWLATTGAVTPFIGLFGTVWGIIDAFHGLGTSGAATLRAVAPGISEALITTAAGLFAAIPAVIAYNILLNQVREFGSRMDDFSLEIMNTVERNSVPARPTPVAEPEFRS
jgi:biopolymer transport protein TolQ